MKVLHYSAERVGGGANLLVNLFQQASGDLLHLTREQRRNMDIQDVTYHFNYSDDTGILTIYYTEWQEV